MSDNLYRQNVYSKDLTCWHKKGTVGTEDETASEVYSKMSPVHFEKREYSIVLNKQNVGSKQFAIVRINAEGNEKVIGTTKGQYHLTQPEEYAEIYDNATGKFCETLGFLGTDAEKMFITSKLDSIDIFGDKHNLYHFLSVGFDGIYGEHQYLTDVRVVCANTHNMAVADSESTNNRGFGSLYRGRHNQPNHVRDLSAWLKHVQKQSEEMAIATKNLFCKMEETPITVDDAFGLAKVVYPSIPEIPQFFPDELRDEKQEKIDEKQEKVEESRDLVMDLFKGSGIQITPTAYGLYNCFTEAKTYEKSKKDPISSLLIGNRQNVMEKALSVIGDWVVGK